MQATCKIQELGEKDTRPPWDVPGGFAPELFRWYCRVREGWWALQMRLSRGDGTGALTFGLARSIVDTTIVGQGKKLPETQDWCTLLLAVYVESGEVRSSLCAKYEVR
jgi:hypothetical protein